MPPRAVAERSAAAATSSSSVTSISHPGHPSRSAASRTDGLRSQRATGKALGHQDLGTGQTDPRGRPGDHDAAHGCIMTLMQSALRAATVA